MCIFKTRVLKSSEDMIPLCHSMIMFVEVFCFAGTTLYLKEFMSVFSIKYLHIANKFMVKDSKDTSSIFYYVQLILFECSNIMIPLFHSVSHSTTKFFNNFITIITCFHHLSVKPSPKFEESFSPTTKWDIIKR